MQFIIVWYYRNELGNIETDLQFKQEQESAESFKDELWENESDVIDVTIYKAEIIYKEMR